jgi:DNA helicase HerA-like ATPase
MTGAARSRAGRRQADDESAALRTFLLWLLSELFEELPEVGDPDKPRLVFFFDEAHLLFDEAPKILIDRVEQVVRLIRSKGVGVFFVTQNPLDVPETVLSQLGNRVQHALRAYTPREQKAVKVAAETFRPNPAFDCFEAITNSVSARRWFRHWVPRACPRWSSARSSARHRRASDRSPNRNGRRSWP